MAQADISLRTYTCTHIYGAYTCTCLYLTVFVRNLTNIAFVKYNIIVVFNALMRFANNKVREKLHALICMCT